jgi:PKD repeat protein
VLWNFGDGQTSEEQNPTHIYWMPGKYTVLVTITNQYGIEKAVEKVDYIHLYDFNFFNASISDISYRLPTKTGHGYGPSEYKDGDTAGYDWLWPSSGPETAICFDDFRTEIALVNDAKKQRVYRINDPACWQDRENEYGGGNRIISEIHMRQEHASAGEHVPIRFIEEHLTFKPYDTDLKDAAGYDGEGFPTDMRVDLLMHKNGSLESTKKAKTVTKNGDLVVQGPLEGRNLQSRIKIYEAPWLFTRAIGYYDTIDKAAAPALRKMTEDDYQEELGSLPLIRIARSFSGTLNLATGAAAVGTVGSLVTGPDGINYSAIRFSAAPFGLSDTLPDDLDDDFTLFSWIKDVLLADLPMVLWKCGNLTVNLANAAGVFRLSITDGVNPAIIQDLAMTGTVWTLLSIIRHGLFIYIFENKTLQSLSVLNSIENYGTDMKYGQSCACSHADMTALPREISDEAIEYYYDDVVDSEGEAVMPLF